MGRKAEAKKNFNGSDRLFQVCWRQLTDLERQGLVVDEVELTLTLDSFAGARVNDEKSPFYMYG